MGFFRRRKPLSLTRRMLRLAVWMSLVVVIWMRWKTPIEPMPRFRNGTLVVAGGQNMNGQWRRQRDPVPRFTPVAAIPKDFPRIEIEVSRRDFQKLLGYRWNGWQRGGGGGGEERPEVQVTVREGGITYTNVALHPKGSAGSSRPFDDKPAMTLNFSKHQKGRTFRGYSKISLNNSVQDPTYLSEAICRGLFLEAGVPVPRVEHATVILNGQDLGLYVLAEGWGKPFLRQHFKDEDGNLYDGGFVQDITEDLAVNSGDEKQSRADLDRLIAAVSEGSPTQRWERLNEVLDMDRFLTFMALEVMTCHWDGYAQNRNNYRVFHDRSTGKMVFMPHGLDQTFGTGRSNPNASIRPSMSGLVARAAIGTPMGRKLYMERIAALRNGIFQEEKLTNQLWTLARRLQPTLAAYSPDLAAWHRSAVADYAARIGERTRSITAQLGDTQDSLSFDASGVARLSGWRASMTGGTQGAARFQRETADDSKLLRIRMNQAGGVASWRTRVTLESGRYRFEGRVKTHGVEPPGGVTLRISGARVSAQSLEDGTWKVLRFGMESEEILTEVELVCELRSNGGEAVFDEGSLVLVREP
ncbi:MAG: CotH kinase family protein [Limisphaerales bacterium]